MVGDLTFLHIFSHSCKISGQFSKLLHSDKFFKTSKALCLVIHCTKYVVDQSSVMCLINTFDTM